MPFVLRTLVAWRRFILLCGIAGALALVAIAFHMPRWYRATTTLLPPEPSAALPVPEELARRLATPLLGPIAAGASPGSVFIAVLESRAVGETLIAEFGLSDVYDAATFEESLDALHSHCDFVLRDNGVLVITFEDKDPRRAAQVANRMVDLLDELTRGLRNTRAGRTREFIEQQMLERRGMLSQVENSLREFQERNRTIDVDQQLALAMELITDLTARALFLEIEMRIAAHYSSPATPEYRRMQAEYDGVVDQLAKLKHGGKGGRSDPAGGFIPALADVPEVALEYARLRREVAVQTKVYTLLLAEYERACVEAARDTPIIQVLDRAQEPSRHARPRRVLLVLAGLVLDLGWCSALALLVSAWREDRWHAAAARELLAPVARDVARLHRRRGER